MVASTLHTSPDESCALLGAVAEPARLAILHRLATGRRCVCDLQPDQAIAASLLSYHLRVLREAGLVHAIKRGRWVDYELAPDALTRLHAAIPAAPSEG